MTAKERVFITGATGFLGSWIIAQMVKSGIEVVATDVRNSYARLTALRLDLSPDRKPALVDFRHCDITDAAQIESLIAETRPTCIIHLAALQIPQCREMPSLAVSVNIGGHINVFEAARKVGVEKIIYTSSIAAKPRGHVSAPSNLYGVFKKADEEIARIYWDDFQMSSLGLRPYVVYGVGRDDGETSAITRAIEAAALGLTFEIPFSTKSCFQYAGDVADIFVKAASASWNGALLSDISEKTHSTDEVLAAIHAEVPYAAVTCAKTPRISPSDGFDTSVLRQLIGHIEENSLREGIHKTVALYREIAAR